MTPSDRPPAALTIPHSAFRNPHSLFVLAAGVVFTLALQSTIRDEVFISGDAGLKALLTKQFASGDWHWDLRLPAEDWVRDLWNRGYYPFEPPFVYAKVSSFESRVSERGPVYFLAFPVWFPMLSAPFYALLGFRGLYVIPLVSTWIIWLRFYFVCRRLGVAVMPTSLALAALIFAAPLSLYSAMYWEHTPAAALSFCGVAEVVATRSTWRAALGGVLLGLSAWLRPECGCVALAVVIAAAPGMVKGGGVRKWLTMLFATLIPLAIFAVLNESVYGRPLGVHSVQVLGGATWTRHLWRWAFLFRWLNSELLVFTPALVFVLGYPVTAFLRKDFAWSPPLRLLLIALVLSCLFIPAIVPHEGGGQWGPRFMLPLVPMISLAAALVLGELRAKARPRVRNAGLAALICVILAGAALNSGSGVTMLARNYEQRVLSALRLVRESLEEVVVVSHQFVAQELEAAMAGRAFLRCTTDDGMRKLAPRLRAAGHDRFLFLLAVYDAGPVARELSWQSADMRVSARRLGRYGDHYYAYDCRIDQVDSAAAAR